MSVLDSKHKRKSFVITTSILLLLLFLIFNFGMTYLDPPEEYGLAINFGDANVGQGDPVEKTKKVATPKIEEKQEVVEEVKEIPKETVKEDVITDDTSKDVPVVEKSEEKKKPIEKVEKIEKPKEIPKPKPSKEATDALNNLLNGNADSGKPKGEGDDKKDGVKGNEKGDENSAKYYGNTGGGSDGNYNLGDRKVLDKPTVKSDCQVDGKVVVEIIVDRSGKVISANPGVKGSTITDTCLNEVAKKAALKTKWEPDKSAKAQQKGTIIYYFALE